MRTLNTPAACRLQRVLTLQMGMPGAMMVSAKAWAKMRVTTGADCDSSGRMLSSTMPTSTDAQRRPKAA